MLGSIDLPLFQESRVCRFGYEICLHHHERWDGGGYPDGMKCDEIPLEARIISVADSLDAMISDRQYRKGFPLSKALDELRRGKGTQFDPDLVDILLGLIEKMGAEQFLEETGAKRNSEPPAK